MQSFSCLGGAGCHFCAFEGCLWRVFVLLELRHHRFRTIEDDGVTSWQSKVPPKATPNKALLREPMVNSPLIRPANAGYLLGGKVSLGGYLRFP